MPDQPVKGEEALRRMAGRALDKSGKPLNEKEPDPIENALAVKKKLMADDILSTELAKSQATKAEAEAKAEKARAEAAKATAEAKRIEAGGEEATKTGFKFTGGVDLGHIDLAQERKEASEELKRLKEEADDAAKATGQENQQLRDKINEQNINYLQLTFQAQMEQLTKLIEANSSKKSFIDQYTETLETSKALGLARPSAESTDLQTSLALKKLDFDQAVELRRLAREERAEGRRWQMELRKLDDDRDARKVEAARQAKKDEMWGNFPTLIGGAAARAVMETEGAGGVSKAPKGKTGQHIEAGAGESGEFECSSCSQPVAIGPTAKSAVCSNCGAKYAIKRGEPEVAPEEE